MSDLRPSFKQRTIRSLFLTYDKAKRTTEDVENEILTTGMKYIQLKLPVEKITNEFEAELTKKVESNFLNAKIRDSFCLPHGPRLAAKGPLLRSRIGCVHVQS